MNIVLPIVFFAVAVGLFVRKMTPRLWALVVAWIVLVVAYNYVKPANLAPPGGGPAGASGAAAGG